VSVESYNLPRLHRLESQVEKLAELAGRLIELVERDAPRPRLELVAPADDLLGLRPGDGRADPRA
jgi:hypothetical protein